MQGELVLPFQTQTAQQSPAYTLHCSLFSGLNTALQGLEQEQEQSQLITAFSSLLRHMQQDMTVMVERNPSAPSEALPELSKVSREGGIWGC